jgi:hypothetical protein
VPILLQLKILLVYKAYHFKLNAHWLNEQDFVELVRKIWKDPMFLSERGNQKRLVWKLKVKKNILNSGIKLRWKGTVKNLGILKLE